MVKKTIGIQLEDKEIQLINKASLKENRTRSNFIRHHLVEIAKQIITPSGKGGNKDERKSKMD